MQRGWEKQSFAVGADYESKRFLASKTFREDGGGDLTVAVIPEAGRGRRRCSAERVSGWPHGWVIRPSEFRQVVRLQPAGLRGKQNKTKNRTKKTAILVLSDVKSGE